MTPPPGGQDGARFYLEGTRLIASDAVYALSLLHKALSGNTLQAMGVGRGAHCKRRTGCALDRALRVDRGAAAAGCPRPLA